MFNEYRHPCRLSPLGNSTEPESRGRDRTLGDFTEFHPSPENPEAQETQGWQQAFRPVVSLRHASDDGNEHYKVSADGRVR